MPGIDPPKEMDQSPNAAAQVQQTRGILRRLALFILPLLPVIYLLGLVAKYGVDVPFADEFTLSPLLLKAHQNAITFSDLFTQHSEHRYFFPSLLFIAFARFAQGNLRAEMFFSVFLTMLVSVNLWLLVRKTISHSPSKTLVVIFLLNLLLFSPVQAENWTWGFQFPLFLCNYLFSCALLAAVSELHIGKKFTICAVLAFVATFSFGGGVVLWALTFPLVLLSHKDMTWKSRISWCAAWGCTGLGSIALYFFHYVKPPYHPSIAASGNPMDYFFYVATFLGAHLSRASRLEPILPAAMVGTALLALYFGAIAYAFGYRRDFTLTNRMLPWLALGAYSVLDALLAAAARIGFGINQALDSRYTSFSLYLSVAAVGLAAIVKKDIRSRSKSERYEGIVVRVETILLTAFAVFSLMAFSWGRSFMIDSQRTRLWAKGALLFSNVIDSGEIYKTYLMANAPEARMFANMLDSIGLMHPRMLRSAEISKLETRTKQAGYLDKISISGQSCSIRGWAIIPKTRTPAHCVVLSYEDPTRGTIVFRVADEIQNRPDVAAALRNNEAEASGWVCHFDRSALPPGDHLLSAWSFDANRATLYPLGTPKIVH